MAVANTTLAFDILTKYHDKGIKQAERGFSSLGSKAKAFGGLALKTLGVAAAGGVAALGVAFVKGAKDAAAFEVLAAKTAAVIKSTGNVANISVKGVQGLAASLERMSGVDEELIINAENVLATFTRVRNETGKGNDIFNRATGAILDMSTALGVDMQSATIQVGKALNDPIKGLTALRRVGVSFTDKQKELITRMVESGDIMGAQKVILKELAVEFGGAAKAAGDTFTGKIARAKDALFDMGRDLAAKALPALGMFADWFTDTGIPAFKAFLTYVTGTFIPKVGEIFGGLKDTIEGILPDIDWSAITKDLFDEAKGWGSTLIAGVKIGLDTGDWSVLGSTIGKGLVAAVNNIGKFLGQLTAAFLKWFEKVDWVGIGLALGKQVPSLLLGLATGILTFDLGGLLKGLAKHWQDILIGILALAFTPLKIIQAIGKILAKIPFVGKLLEWGLLHMKKFADGLVKAVGSALSFLSRAFLEGFRRVFPGIGKKFSEWLSLLPTRLGVVALNLFEKVRAMMRGLALWIGRGISGVVAKIGELIARMLRPFARAGSWLLRTGANILSGLKSGIINGLSGIGSWVKRHIIDPIVGAVKRFFGIKSPSTVFAGIGRNLVAGLVGGMARTSGAAIATKIFGDMPRALGAIVKKGLVALGSLPAKAMAALGKLGGWFAGLFGGGAKGGTFGSGVQRWAGLVSQVLGMLGQSQAWLPAVLRRMQRESGGNPSAINLWDINAQRGTPSIGLMQTIGPTFNAYAGPFRSRGIYDPLANIYAGLNYALHRYGSLAVMDRPGGYDNGGWLPTGLSLAYNGTGRPERILSPRQSAAAGGVNVNGPIHVHGVQDVAALIAELQRYAKRNGGIKLKVVTP